MASLIEIASQSDRQNSKSGGRGQGSAIGNNQDFMTHHSASAMTGVEVFFSVTIKEKYEAYFMEKYEEGLINPRFDEGLWSRASGGKNKGKLYGFNNVDDPSALINGIPSTSCSSTSHGSGIQDTEIQRLKGIIEGLVAEKEIEKAEKQSEKAEKEREKTEKESMHERLTTIEAMLKLVLQNLPSSS
ncbi:hypothetical protein QVD17_32127 [Tagetes erecta]|uniref:Uncharacterized protein n=1 Tax=Tagetes erecta TaxID=13708 RepID=A0AAD8K5N6_TARER|nr:hypothetical protein QVD17_32127 [Tagetes erecta]